MKREIEFRGKTKNCKYRKNGEWIYGFYMNKDGKDIIVDTTCGSIGMGLEVDGETVGQYVGIKDKNGRKVYVGDIVYCSDFNCEVVFGMYDVGDYKTVGFFMKVNETSFTDEEDDFAYWGFEESDEIEVLGNVFDNPELLNKIEYKGESDNGD